MLQNIFTGSVRPLFVGLGLRSLGFTNDLGERGFRLEGLPLWALCRREWFLLSASIPCVNVLKIWRLKIVQAVEHLCATR